MDYCSIRKRLPTFLDNVGARASKKGRKGFRGVSICGSNEGETHVEVPEENVLFHSSSIPDANIPKEDSGEGICDDSDDDPNADHTSDVEIIGELGGYWVPPPKRRRM